MTELAPAIVQYHVHLCVINVVDARNGAPATIGPGAATFGRPPATTERGSGDDGNTESVIGMVEADKGRPNRDTSRESRGAVDRVNDPLPR